MKIVKTFYNTQLAHLDLAKLRDEGIDAFLQDDNVATINPLYAHAIGGIKLMVQNEDYNTAIEALNMNDFEYLHNEYPEEISAQRKCMECGSINVYQKSSWLIALIYMLLFFIPVVIKKKKFICLDCSNQWKE